VDRLLDYTYLEGTDSTGQGYDEHQAFLQASPFMELTRTQRGWSRDPGATARRASPLATAAP
jgi:hypothetical protein